MNLAELNTFSQLDHTADRLLGSQTALELEEDPRLASLSAEEDNGPVVQIQ